jgi:glucose repression mediator protein
MALNSFQKKKKQFRDALDAYSRAIRLNPYLSEVWYNLGTLYESCGQISDSLDAYSRAAELDPGHKHIQQRLVLLRKQLSGDKEGIPMNLGDVGPMEVNDKSLPTVNKDMSMFNNSGDKILHLPTREPENSLSSGPSAPNPAATLSALNDSNLPTNLGTSIPGMRHLINATYTDTSDSSASRVSAFGGEGHFSLPSIEKEKEDRLPEKEKEKEKPKEKERKKDKKEKKKGGRKPVEKEKPTEKEKGKKSKKTRAEKAREREEPVAERKKEAEKVKVKGEVPERQEKAPEKEKSVEVREKKGEEKKKKKKKDEKPLLEAEPMEIEKESSMRTQERSTKSK